MAVQGSTCFFDFCLNLALAQGKVLKKRRLEKEPSEQVKKARQQLNSATELDAKLQAAIAKRKAGMSKRLNDSTLYFFAQSISSV